MRKFFIMSFLGLLLSFVSSPSIAEIQSCDQNLLTALQSTVPTQSRLLIDINIALVHGSISTEQAINLRRAVCRLGEEEDRYLAAGKPISANILQQEVSGFAAIRRQLQGYEQLASAQQLKGSALLQDQVRSDVDRRLSQRKISVSLAHDLRHQVNSICTEEAWFLSNDNGTIPETVIQKDAKVLKGLEGQLNRSLAGSIAHTF